MPELYDRGTEQVTYDDSLFEWLDRLPAYDLTEELSESLTVARWVIGSDNYQYGGYVMPQNNTPTIPGLGNLEGNVNIPTGSVILNIGTWASFTEQQGVTQAGFKFNIYDMGAKHSIFGRTYQYSAGQGSFFPLPPTQDTPIGPYWVREPLIVIKPGQIQWQITNLSTVAATIQVFLTCAIPITRENLNQAAQQGHN